MENKGKTRIRSTSQQLKLLTEHMQTHPRLAHGEFSGPQGRLTENRQWEELRAVLSEHGPDKSIDQWKVTWRDLRRKARTEGSVARLAANSTGNATVEPVLTEQTIKILDIMSTEGAFGIPGGEESGIGSTPAALSGIPAPVDLIEDTIVEISHDEVTAQDPSQQGARPSSGQHRPRLPLNEGETGSSAATSTYNRNKRKASFNYQVTSNQATSEVCTTDTIKSATQELSEFDIAGMNVAKKISRMNPLQAIYAESIINHVLRTGLLNKLTDDTDICDNYCNRRLQTTSVHSVDPISIKAEWREEERRTEEL